MARASSAAPLVVLVWLDRPGDRVALRRLLPAGRPDDPDLLILPSVEAAEPKALRLVLDRLAAGGAVSLVVEPHEDTVRASRRAAELALRSRANLLPAALHAGTGRLFHIAGMRHAEEPGLALGRLIPSGAAGGAETLAALALASLQALSAPCQARCEGAGWLIP